MPTGCIPLGDALAMLDRCLGHTPTLEEAYSVKARILKHAGDPTGAAASADKARYMDLADRRGPRHFSHPLHCNSIVVAVVP